MSIATGLHGIGYLIKSFSTFPSRVYTVYSEITSFIEKTIPSVKELKKFTIAQPDNVREIAGRLAPDIRRYVWNPELDHEIFLKISEAEIKSLIREMQERIEKIKKVDAQFGEALDLLLEHFIVRLHWLLDKPDKYIKEILEFARYYEDDTNEYTILLISSILLLRALSRRIPLGFIQRKDLEKREILVKKLIEIVEELESYTATFQLMKEPIKEEELEIVGEVKSLEELKRVIGIE